MIVVVLGTAGLAQAQVGSIGGTVYDLDFDTILPFAKVTIADLGREVEAGNDGRYFINNVEPGTYTLVISAPSYKRETFANVVVRANQETTVNAKLTGDFTDMREVVVQQLEIDPGSEAEVLELRFEFKDRQIDGVGADFLSKSGASDAEQGAKLIAGVTTTDGGFAAVRGLPPRFVSTQLNGFVLPSADPDTRAVQLDLFPSEIIESIQVSKTFTPDQQGDASGGAVNVVTKSVPLETFITFNSKVEYNTQRPANGEFLRDEVGNVPFFAQDFDERGLPGSLRNLDGVSAGEMPQLSNRQFGGAGPVYDDAPIQYEFGVTGGIRHELANGWVIGGLATYFWDQGISHFDDGLRDSRNVNTGNRQFGMLPDATGQGFLSTPVDGADNNVLTSLFDRVRSKHEITTGGMGTFGLEGEDHSIQFTFMHTRVADTTSTIDTDTRGKELKFSGHDSTLQTTPGGFDSPAGATNQFGEVFAAGDFSEFTPFRRLETQEYVERQVTTYQLQGRHTLSFLDGVYGLRNVIEFMAPKIDWNFARSESVRDEPGTRIFDTKFLPPNPDTPTGSQVNVEFFNATALGAYNVVFREISENSEQYRVNLELPFRQWNGEEGAFKFGVYNNATKRNFAQNTFSGGAASFDTNITLLQTFDQARLSQAFSDPGSFTGLFFFQPEVTLPPPFPPIVIQPAENFDDPGFLLPRAVDFRYDGFLDVDAWYWQVDLPINKFVRLSGGLRFENTEIKTFIQPDTNTTQVFLDGPVLAEIPGTTPGVPVGVNLAPPLDVDLRQEDILPSVGITITPFDGFIFRASYSETIARPTFRELTPVAQSLFAGATPFVGNPFLELSDVENYDLRIDYRPTPGSLFSASFFRKDVTDVIQVVQQAQGNTNIVIPVNFPEGQIIGFEFEARQNIGELLQNEKLGGVTIGANLTLLDTEAKLRDFEKQQLSRAGFPADTVEMTNAPEYLYNLFMTFDVPETATSLSVFYTVRGETLIITPGVENDSPGGGTADFYLPPVYEGDFGTLNLTITQKIAEIFSLKFSAKNLTNPEIVTFYRDDRLPGGDVIRSRFTRGIDLSLAAKVNIEF